MTYYTICFTSVYDVKHFFDVGPVEEETLKELLSMAKSNTKDITNYAVQLPILDSEPTAVVFIMKEMMTNYTITFAPVEVRDEDQE